MSAQNTLGLRVEARWEKVGGADEVVAWEVWSDDEWLETFDDEGDAIDYRAALAKTTGNAS